MLGRIEQSALERGFKRLQHPTDPEANPQVWVSADHQDGTWPSKYFLPEVAGKTILWEGDVLKFPIEDKADLLLAVKFVHRLYDLTTNGYERGSEGLVDFMEQFASQTES